MLEKLNLDLTLSKKDFENTFNEKMERLGELQRLLHQQNIPVIILFEGWLTSTKGEIINSIVQALDPRGFKVHTAFFSKEEERERPFFWRFWNIFPPKGQIAILDRSWYWQSILKVLQEELTTERLSESFQDINSLERMLTDDNHVIIKFFTHISKKDYQSRIQKMLRKLKNTASLSDSNDWSELSFLGEKTAEITRLIETSSYDKLIDLYESMFEKTDTEFAPWIPIEASNLQFAQMKVLDSVIQILERKYKEVSNLKISPKKSQKKSDKTFYSSALSTVDLSLCISKEEYQKLLPKYEAKLRALQLQLFLRKIPLIIGFEGWDAGGKGGAIKRLTQNLDPRAYHVNPTASPDIVDKSYHYLWRFWKVMPQKGTIAIFDRTWYGRVMVERVEGFATEEEWKRAYREINEMEDQLIHDGNILLKFWFQIDRKEQLKRFKAREKNPLKTWKITDEDWRNREKWDDYEIAVNEMLFRTSTTQAPWTLVEGNCKRYARLKVLQTVISAIEHRLNQ